MKASKFIFPLLLLASCSKSTGPKTLISELTKLGEDSVSLERQMASTVDNRCLIDLFSTENLKLEVANLEKSFSRGTKVTGTWKHLDLSTLPVAQAMFLKSYGNKIGDLADPSNIDYSGCSDLPCVINRVYGQTDGEAGYVHYLWYLRFNQLLAANNYVHGALGKPKPGEYAGKNVPLKDYLYSRNELYGWWRLMKMNKLPFTGISTLQEIHRVPRGQSFDFVQEERNKLRLENERLRAQGKPEKPQQQGEVCGLAYSQGYIVLQDVCLMLSKDIDSGNFYDTVTHEFGHHVDYTEGRKIRRSYRSTETDYVAMSGFKLNEYVDENGRTVKAWALVQGGKYISDYAKTSPVENFAETLAFYRHEGDKTKSLIAENHYQWVSSTYFEGKDYTAPGLISVWLDEATPLLTQATLSAFASCQSTPTLVPGESFLKSSDFPVPVSAAMASCLSRASKDLSLELQNRIRVREAQGCRQIKRSGFKDVWEPALKSRVVALYIRYLQEMEKDKEYLAKIEQFARDIKNPALATSAFLACYDQKSPQDCYGPELTSQVLKQLQPLNLPEEKAKDLAALYLQTHPFEVRSQEILSLYGRYISSQGEIVGGQADALWASCLDGAVDDQATPVGKFFSVGDGYMVSSMYNCLNRDFPETVKDIIRDMGQAGVKIEHPQEELILTDLLIPDLQKRLTAIYLAAVENEKKSADEIILSGKGRIRTELLTNFDWISSVVNADQIDSDCATAALAKIGVEVRYHVKSKYFGRFVREEICAGIQQTEQFDRWLESSKAAVQANAYVGLEKLVLGLGTERAKYCIGRFPMDSEIARLKFKAEREACLILQWSKIEEQAIKDYAADPLVQRFKIDPAQYRGQLSQGRRRLQLRIMKENFGG